jgi:N-glycosylase/DNA lyase
LSEECANKPDGLEAVRLSLKKTYHELKPAIEERLSAFSAVWADGDDRVLFREMCFCTCTPQTNAHKGWAAANALYQSEIETETGWETKLLTEGTAVRIAEVLRGCGVRFHNNKALYIVQNRDNFWPHTKKRLTEILQSHDPQTELCRRVAGWGMKEAAHFMRNIGFGHIASILDRHILRQLALCGVIAQIPRSLTVPLYREIDAKMKQFAQELNIPLAALDLVFWYHETGEIFK